MADLTFIENEMIRYGMSTYLVLGLLGNLCNCIVFTLRSHRRTATSIYFLCLSIFAIIYLLWSIIPYLYTLNNIEPDTQSLFYCKVRLYGSHVLGLYLRYIVVFTCIDRFIVTRTDVRVRALSSVPTAMKLIAVMFIVCPTIAIHLPISMTINNNVCGMFGIYRLIFAIYQVTIVGLLPPILMCIFSILTIRSLYQRHETQLNARRKDRHLLRMVVAEVILNISTSIPYSTNLVYGAVTYNLANKSTERIEIESFISFITQFLIYFISVGPFYIFVLTSKPFRNDLIKMFVTFWYKRILRRVRIVPLSEQNKAEANNHRALDGTS